MIENLGFYFAGFAGGLLTLSYGIMLLVSPNLFLRFGAKVGRLMGMRSPSLDLGPGLHLPWRLLGLVAVCLAIFIFHSFISVALR